MKMDVSGRIILLVAGLALAWCAVWGASEMQAWALPSKGTEENAPMRFFVIIGCFAVSASALLLAGFIKRIRQDTSYDDASEVLEASAQFISFAFLFGAIVAPVRDNATIGAWISPWVFLLVLGFLPTVFVVREIIFEIVAARRTNNGVQAGDAKVKNIR